MLQHSQVVVHFGHSSSPTRGMAHSEHSPHSNQREYFTRMGYFPREEGFVLGFSIVEKVIELH